MLQNRAIVYGVIYTMYRVSEVKEYGNKYDVRSISGTLTRSNWENRKATRRIRRIIVILTKGKKRVVKHK